ncbi:MAG: EF-hand domain-containing protein [Gemmobacter sp.]|uniref:EF-hand domain-containing protein n=1 Tax=Gemmobacter sp. TaxID=1898957 RepID=UPI001A449F03|nr:EF-hand domain-containing protein [Gemmobacter sp.]MBL8562488.1 EF-hand domain-containing protein [Gemmobacter sp.]
MQKRTIGYSLALAALLSGALGTAAVADRMRDHGPGPMGMMMGHGPMGGPDFDFDALDADKDGKITPEEFKTFRAAQLKAVDTDNDGKITEAELVAEAVKRAEARAKAVAPEMLKELDADADGAVSVIELQAAGPQMGGKMLRRIDTDGDGAVSKAELEAMKAKWAERGGPGQHGGKHGGGKHGHGLDGQPPMPEAGN